MESLALSLGCTACERPVKPVEKGLRRETVGAVTLLHESRMSPSGCVRAHTANRARYKPSAPGIYLFVCPDLT